MKKILIITKWEYWEKVKTKTFLLSLILTPAIIIFFSLLPSLLIEQDDTTTKSVGVVDTSGVYVIPLQEIIKNYKIKNNLPNFILINLRTGNDNLNQIKTKADNEVLSNVLDGYLLILNGNTDSTIIELRSINNFSPKEVSRLEEALNQVRIDQRLTALGLNRNTIKFATDKLHINTLKIEQGGKESKSEFLYVFFSSLIFIILLMMIIMYSGGMLIRSIIEEKSNRLIEILISSCTPDELLTGKILGLSLLGLTQVFVWLVLGLSLISFTSITAETFSNIIPILFYFILGFVFYTAVFVGLGSITNTEQQAQHVSSYLNLILVIPIVLILQTIQHPNSVLVQIFSYIPFTLPSMMILRFNAGPVSVYEFIITTVIMLLSIYIVIKLASKIFKTGIISYDRIPAAKDLFKG